MKCPYEKCNNPRDFTQEELEEHLRRSHKQKIKQAQTEQYGKADKVPDTHPDLCLVSRNSLTYPACIKHGALIAHAEGIYRCIECGWAVKKS